MKNCSAFLALLFVALSTSSSVVAFVPSVQQNQLPQKTQPQQQKTFLSAQQNDHHSADQRRVASGLARFFGVAGAIAAFTFHPLNAPAAIDYTEGPAMSSTSLQLADVIKTLDMTMPSYGEIKSPKASTENVESLTVKPTKDGGGAGMAASQKKKGMSASSVLPSMGKKSAKQKAAEKADAIGYTF